MFNFGCAHACLILVLVNDCDFFFGLYSLMNAHSNAMFYYSFESSDKFYVFHSHSKISQVVVLYTSLSSKQLVVLVLE